MSYFETNSSIKLFLKNLFKKKKRERNPNESVLFEALKAIKPLFK